MSPDRSPSFAEHVERLSRTHLRELLKDGARDDSLRLRLGSILLDLSRQKIDGPALDALGAFVQASEWEKARDAMFAGAPINTSENRAVLHTALRASGSRLSSPAPREALKDIEQTLERIEKLVHAVEQGQTEALGLAPTITDIVNIGIGGSDLGPRLATHALNNFHLPRIRSHFLTNVDGQAAADIMRELDPKRTLVICVSKTFTTQETLLNSQVLRDWIVSAHGGDEGVVKRHFLAVSANVKEAKAWGIAESNIYPMWDFVGGRLSVWSAVGLSLALAIGMDHFRAFLAGAAEVDDHFRTAPWRQNLPVLLSLVEYWNRNVQGHASRAVIPYADLLGDLTSYLQQLEMESLGKHVTPQGEAVTHATVPVVWGSVGTNAQHAYFQALHQGTDVVPLEFIGVIKPGHTLRANNDALLSNLLAQAAALALGKTTDEALAEAKEGDEAARRALAEQRTFEGDRPSTVFLLDALTPHSLGALIALYEHKVFMLGHLWGVNAFDQWGVELGKAIARQILPALNGDAKQSSGLDTSTQALIQAIKDRREG